MDTIQHITHGVLISEITLKIAEVVNCESLPLLVILYYANIVGALLPDLAGWLEKLVYDDKSRWNWYKKLHVISEKNFLIYIPGGLLHIFLDKFGHGDGKHWWVWNERLWLEVVGWVITILVAYIIWR